MKWEFLFHIFFLIYFFESRWGRSEYGNCFFCFLCRRARVGRSVGFGGFVGDSFLSTHILLFPFPLLFLSFLISDGFGFHGVNKMGSLLSSLLLDTFLTYSPIPIP